MNTSLENFVRSRTSTARMTVRRCSSSIGVDVSSKDRDHANNTNTRVSATNTSGLRLRCDWAGERFAGARDEASRSTRDSIFDRQLRNSHVGMGNLAQTPNAEEECKQRTGGQTVARVSGAGCLPSTSLTPNSTAAAAATTIVPLRSDKSGSAASAAITRPRNSGLSLLSSVNQPCDAAASTASVRTRPG